MDTLVFITILISLIILLMPLCYLMILPEVKYSKGTKVTCSFFDFTDSPIDWVIVESPKGKDYVEIYNMSMGRRVVPLYSLTKQVK